LGRVGFFRRAFVAFVDRGVVEEVAAVNNRGADDQPDEIPPVKDEIDLDDFAKVDLRVCKIVKAQEIRKSHSCLKLTLDDGTDEPRTIVSSIKKEWGIDELVGRKIIVIANLKPTRLTGVTSEGLLLAATNHSCGCQLIFVDDSVPTGTVIK
jgi:lysyl-tRNA synthetase class 1